MSKIGERMSVIGKELGNIVKVDPFTPPTSKGK